MPRKLVKKRKFRGNKYTKLSASSTGSTSLNSSLVGECSASDGISSLEARPSPELANPRPVSSSKKKLSYIPDFIENVTEENKQVNVIVDLDILSKLVSGFVRCKSCGEENSVILEEDQNSRQGLASKILISCIVCKKENTAVSSKITKHRQYEINSRFAYGLRSIGKGETAGRTLCAVMNLPPPVDRFMRHNRHIANAVSIVAENSMREAAIEAVKENDGITDIAAAFDGTWQRRGHSSLNGVVTVTAFDTGKVIDVECLTKYCQTCTVKKQNCGDNCVKNYSGSSGGMEGVGVVRIFLRSELNRGVRYVKYLGDGDSNSFSQVCTKKPYGENVTVEKLECIGHVQKRLGSRLRRLKTKMKGVKLSDGKVLSGKGRLTDSDIDQLQNYYGLAIRRNIGDVEGMRKDIWAIYYHKLSTNSDPQHGLCPKEETTWCKYNKCILSKEKNIVYEHKNSLPSAVMETIKPIFKDLSNKDLLKKCKHGKTQNPNESLNNVIWCRIPKTNFVGFQTLKIGVFDAIITFNNGAMGRAKVLKEMGIVPGANAIAGFAKADSDRLKKAEKAVLNLTKESRQKRRAQKRKKEDQEAADNLCYGPGQF